MWRELIILSCFVLFVLVLGFSAFFSNITVSKCAVYILISQSGIILHLDVYNAIRTKLKTNCNVNVRTFICM